MPMMDDDIRAGLRASQCKDESHTPGGAGDQNCLIEQRQVIHLKMDFIIVIHDNFR
jgi:hypothetical protein